MNTPEQMVEKAKSILFPPDEISGDRSSVDHSADGNLDAVIIDLEARGADKVCIGSLNKILAQLMAARAALGADQEG